MIITICYPDSAFFWLNGNNNTDPYSLKNRELLSVPSYLGTTSSSAIISNLIQQYQFPGPVHLLVSDPKLRISRKNIICHVKSDLIPAGSFIKIGRLITGDDVFVECPEYCFLHAAKYMSFCELVRLGYSLCARYVSDNNSKYHQRNRLPLTSAANISAYLERCHGAPGIKKAQRATKYVLDNSNSPMETRLAIVSTFPFFMGGFGVKKPDLNPGILLSQQGRDLLGFEYCSVDMEWKAERTVLEYDSNMTHLDIKQHAIDKKRSTALNLSGYKVISLTADNFRNFAAFENTFASIRHTLGMKPENDRLEAYRDKRYEMFHFLIRG